MVKQIEIGVAGKLLRQDFLLWIDRVASSLLIQADVSQKPDGSIKVVAEGEEQDLLLFTRKLEQDGLFSTIENFYVKWHEKYQSLHPLLL